MFYCIAVPPYKKALEASSVYNVAPFYKYGRKKTPTGKRQEIFLMIILNLGFATKLRYNLET